MPVERLTPNTYIVEPVDFSHTLKDDEILVEPCFFDVAGKVDRAIVKPISIESRVTSFAYFPSARIKTTYEVEEGCVLPSSWIERVEEFIIDQYGIPRVIVRENVIAGHLSEMFREARAVVLNAELNFLNDWNEFRKQEMFYRSLQELMKSRYGARFS